MQHAKRAARSLSVPNRENLTPHALTASQWLFFACSTFSSCHTSRSLKLTSLSAREPYHLLQGGVWENSELLPAFLARERALKSPSHI